MHIAIVSPEFPPDIGGVETYAFEFATELVRQGHQVTVFTIPHEAGEVKCPGVEVLPWLRYRRRRDIKIIDDFQADAWHVMNAAYAWVAEEKSPCVVSIHGNDFLEPYLLCERLDLGRHRFMRWFRLEWDMAIGRWLTARSMRRGLTKATHILANSGYTESVFLRHFPGCAGNTSVGWVGLGSDFHSVPERLKPRAEVTQLLTVCRLSEPRKNVGLVLKVLARLKAKYTFHYTIVGEGRLRAELEEFVVREELTQQVTFAGRLSLEELKHRFIESDLFILPSSADEKSHEGFGIVYLEANACGTPVLAARVGGAVEAVEEGLSGFFVDVPTLDALTVALDDFLSGRRHFDCGNCQKFARGFSWPKVVGQAEPYYATGTRELCPELQEPQVTAGRSHD